MVRRGLLIGSPYGGLSGVGNDIASMASLLEKRRFNIDNCFDATATREGILEAWRRLIFDATNGDAVVVYYSGHGGLATETPDVSIAGGGHPWRYQFIVPMDFDKSTDTDFRGIADVELTQLLFELTAKTRNVTLILDCCHAARMARDLDLTPKALPRTHYLGVATHVQQLREKGLLLGTNFTEGNPNAIRVVAAATTESAYEYTNPEGHRVGVLTEALGMALDAACESPVSWRSVLERVRERVSAISPQQHPDIEGPVTRVLFKLDTMASTGALGMSMISGSPVLKGGHVAGIQEGDVYSVMPFGSERADPTTQIAEATVQRVLGATASVKLQFYGEYDAVPEGALAYPASKVLRRWAVRVAGKGAAANELRSRLTSARFIRVAGKDEGNPPLSVARVTGDQLEIIDRAGLLLVKPRLADQAALVDTLANLENLARAQHLLGLKSGFDQHELDVPVALEWGYVKAGGKVPLAFTGETLLAGESVYLTLRNDGNETIYASVFDIGVTGKVTLLSSSAPAGVELPRGKSYTLGQNDYDGTLTGLQLDWPESAPIDAPRRETVAVVLTNSPQDLRSLQTDMMRTVHVPPKREGGGSELARIIDQLSFGGMRDMRPPPVRVDVRYAVHRIGFMLDPSSHLLPGGGSATQLTATDGSYVFDERPDRSLARSIPPVMENFPNAIAVRLADLVVHRNKVLFGSANLRLDCMIVTGAKEGGSPYRLETVRFPSIRDNERLPMENLLVFHGPVKDFLDIAVWISRDDCNRPSLSDLLREEFNSTEFETAIGTLAGLVSLEPQGAAAVLGLGAAATLTSIGARLVKGAAGKTIGLYRTSLLANESFGVGRHPTSGLMRSQDFSFAYEITKV